MQNCALSAVAENFDGLLDLFNGSYVLSFNKGGQEFVKLVTVLIAD